MNDAQVAKLLPILSERSRASEARAGSFRPPQTGIVEQVGSRWHHFVVGRRGVGKSMLLLTVANRARERGQPVAYIDIETLRDNPFPDLLIRLLIDVTDALERNLRTFGFTGGLRSWRARRRAREDLRSLGDRLDELLRDPQEAVHRLQVVARRRRSKKASAVFGVRGHRRGVSAGMDLTAETSTLAQTSSGRDAQFVRTKLDGLRAEVVEFRQVLSHAITASGSDGALVILDDFYFISSEDQPEVLSYLHQVVKNLNIWLKVGAVAHRLNEFQDGDPPRGLQITQDAAKIPMDNTLADFKHTSAFLESILEDICGEAEVAMEQLVTEKARTRLVMASGGVPRDYINLVQAALGRASRRLANAALTKNRITAEDVNDAAPEFLKQKEADLRRDAGPGEDERLRDRLNDVLTFCLVLRKVNVFSVESRYLREEQWGRDIAALADLRFFHRIGNLTIKSSEAAYVGTRFEGFALDLSSYSGVRVRTKEIEFWTTDGHEQLRAVSYVYTPSATEILRDERKTVKTKSVAPASWVPDQMTVYDVLADMDGEALATGPQASLFSEES